MKNYGSFMMIVGIIAGLFQPAIFTSPVPEPVTTGTLIATTVDETGATVPNACFSLIDDVGTNVPNCDQDGDGVTEFQDVEQGSYRLMNTTIDAGHRPAPEITVAVVAEQVVPVTVTASRILPTETPAPTQGPSLTSTATATEAPTATIAPTATEAPRPASPTATAPATQPVASPTATMAPQSFSDSLINLAVTQTEPVEISCSRIPNSEANNGTYTVNLFNFSGDQATSDPDLMVTGTALTWDYKIVTLDAWHDYNHTFVQPWRRLDVVVTWPDGQQGKGIAECDNFTYDSLVRTQIMSGETEVPVVNAFLPAGRPMNDTATLNPATSEGDLQVLPPWGKTPYDTEDGTGQITYRLYRGQNCTGTPVNTWTVDIGADGTVPPSGEFTVPEADVDVYNWQASYSGNRFWNPSTSPCGSEQVVVGGDGDPIQTTMYMAPTQNGAKTTIATGDAATYSWWVTDYALIPDLPANARGNVTFTLYDTVDCSGDPVFTSRKALPGDQDTTGVFSDAWQLPAAPGPYQWVVVYSGDPTVGARPARSSCGDETFRVAPVNTTLTTTPDYTKRTSIDERDGMENVSVGASASDSATITVTDGNGKKLAFSGDVHFTLYYNPTQPTTCAEGEKVYETIVTISDGTTANGQLNVRTNGANSSNPDPYFLGTSGAGYYDWVASFSGSDYLNPSTGACGDERFVADPIPLTASTSMFRLDENGQEVALPFNTFTTPPFEGGDHLTLTPRESTNQPMVIQGTVTYTLYRNANCSADTTGANVVMSQTVTIEPDGTIPPATIPNDQFGQPLNEFGAFNWEVRFTPSDSRYASAFHPCGDEQFFIPGGIYQLTTKPHAVLNDTDRALGYNELVPYGAQIYDTAQIANTPELSANQANGTITFRLYRNNACTDDALFTSPAFAVTNGKIAAWPADQRFTLTETGTYFWQATLDLDNGSSYDSICELERFRHETLALSDSTMRTTMFRVVDGTAITLPSGEALDGSTLENLNQNGEVLYAQTVYDTVTISQRYGAWGMPIEGTLTYTLYTDEACTQPLSDPNNPTVVTIATGQPSPFPESAHITPPNESRDYYWRVTYTPTSNNNYAPFTTRCGLEKFRYRAPLTIETTMFHDDGTELPNESWVTTMAPFDDTATLTWQGTTPPTGGVTFNVYAGATCDGSPLYSDARTTRVDGPNTTTYTMTQRFTIPAVGQYSLQAVYRGDDTYAQSVSPCGTENVGIIGPPQITTEMHASTLDNKPADLVVPNLGLVTAGETIWDRAFLQGYDVDATGTVTFQIYAGTCQNPGDLIQTVSERTGRFRDFRLNPVISSRYTLPNDLVGAFFWKVTVTPDNGAVPAFSSCDDGVGNDENFTVAQSLNPGIAIGCSYNPDGGGSTFSISVGKLIAEAPDTDPNRLTVSWTAYDQFGKTIETGSNNDYATTFSQQPWVAIRVQTAYTMPDGTIRRSQGASSCNADLLETTTLTTRMTVITPDGPDAIQNFDEIPANATVQDQALFPEGRVPSDGAITYELYANVCDPAEATPVYTETLFFNQGDPIPPSAQVSNLEPLTTYYWRVSLSGSTAYFGAISDCGEEVFVSVPQDLTPPALPGTPTVVPLPPMPTPPPAPTLPATPVISTLPPMPTPSPAPTLPATPVISTLPPMPTPAPTLPATPVISTRPPFTITPTPTAAAPQPTTTTTPTVSATATPTIGAGSPTLAPSATPSATSEPTQPATATPTIGAGSPTVAPSATPSQTPEPTQSVTALPSTGTGHGVGSVTGIAVGLLAIAAVALIGVTRKTARR